jgi:NitT/TauT family transport system ATP-binding protein
LRPMMTTIQKMRGTGDMASAKFEFRIENLSHLRKAGSTTEVVVGPVSLELKRGEFLSVIGPAACGKTALVKMIAGILEMSEGKVCISGAEIHPPCRDFGLVLKRPALLPWRTSMRNILLQTELCGLDSRESRDRARRLLAWFGLSKFEHCLPHELPRGAAEAVAICRALVHNPALLLMDEPFGSLDPLASELVLDAFQRLRVESGTTTLLCTGNMQEAVLLGDRVAVMSPQPGRIMQTFSIDLPRPRRMDKSMTPQIAEYCNRIRTSFRALGILP